MIKAHSSKRKYNFQELKKGEEEFFPYTEHGKIRSAVCAQNLRGEGAFICRVGLIGKTKCIYVQRVK